MHYIFEGESHSINDASNQRHLVRHTTAMSTVCKGDSLALGPYPDLSEPVTRSRNTEKSGSRM